MKKNIKKIIIIIIIIGLIALAMITSLKEDKEELAKQLIDFQSSFIMPCDLENVFETVGEVTNA